MIDWTMIEHIDCDKQISTDKKCVVVDIPYSITVDHHNPVVRQMITEELRERTAAGDFNAYPNMKRVLFCEDGTFKVGCSATVDAPYPSGMLGSKGYTTMEATPEADRLLDPAEPIDVDGEEIDDEA